MLQGWPDPWSPTTSIDKLFKSGRTMWRHSGLIYLFIFISDVYFSFHQQPKRSMLNKAPGLPPDAQEDNNQVMARVKH